MAPKLKLTEIKFRSGQSLPLSENDIVIFVGPNNSGKSQSLKDVRGIIGERSYSPITIKEIVTSRSGTKEEFDELFLRVSDEDRINVGRRRIPGPSPGSTQTIFPNQASSMWVSGLLPMPELAWMFCRMIDTKDRLTVVDPQQPFDPDVNTKQHPFHHLMTAADDEIEEKISDAFSKGFGHQFIYNPFAQKPQASIGERPKFNVKNESISSTLIRKEYDRLPKLHLQGDGMKAFASIAMQIATFDCQIILIDEPEAFLHPPQSRILGRWIARQSHLDHQIIIATHDSYFLRGILDVASSKIKIVRFDSPPNRSAKILHSEDIKTLCTDAGLKNSVALDALFHDLCLLCEGDSDSLFYEALLNTIIENSAGETQKKKRLERIPDALFVPAGGKQNLAKFARLLRKAGVPLRAIVDFDVLNDKSILENLFNSFGGDYSCIQKDHRILMNHISQTRTQKTRDEIKIELARIISGSQENLIDQDEIRQLTEAVRTASPWKAIKTIGVNALPGVEANKRFEVIDSALRQVGIHILEVGQLEGFHRTLASEKAEWITSALNCDLSSPEWKSARTFLRRVLQ